MEWFPHPFQIYQRLLTTFLCYGWGYGVPIMLLLPHLWDQIWKVRWNHWTTKLQWLWLSSHMGWFPHPLKACKRWLTSFVCCGWGYGAPIMLLPPHLWDSIWNVSWNHWWLLGDKWYHHALFEALNTHGMVPTSISNIPEVIVLSVLAA